MKETKVALSLQFPPDERKFIQDHINSETSGSLCKL